MQFLPKSQSGAQILPFLVPFVTARHASSAPKGKGKKVDVAALARKKRERANFRRDDMKHAQLFALCDAMR